MTARTRRATRKSGRNLPFMDSLEQRQLLSTLGHVRLHDDGVFGANVSVVDEGKTVGLTAGTISLRRNSGNSGDYAYPGSKGMLGAFCIELRQPLHGEVDYSVVTP